MSSSSTFPIIQSTSVPKITNPSQPSVMSNQPLTPLFQVASEAEARVKQWTTSIPSGPSFSSSASSSSSCSYPLTPTYHPDFPPFLSFAPNPFPGYQAALRSSASSSASASNPKQPVSYPLQQALSTTHDPVALLKMLNPDFDPFDAKSRKEMYGWLGFPEYHQITPEDLKVIQQKMTYTDLNLMQQGEARRALYRSLRPLLTIGQQTELPFKDSYGHTISIGLVKDLKTQQSIIELFFYGRYGNEHKFSIKENGESTYVVSCYSMTVYVPSHQMMIGEIKVDDHEKKIISYQQPYPNYTEEWLKKDYEKHSNACFNLIMQSHERVRSALTQDPAEKNQRALQLFQACASLISAFAKKEHPLQRSQSSEERQLARKGKEEATTTTYGPFWNPVTNASDSFFQWEIQELGSGGVSFSSKKHSGGRAFHSSSERSVVLSTTQNPDQFKVTVKRNESWDIGASESTSEYLCEINAKGQPVITGLNKEHQYEELGLFIGMPDIQASGSSKPTLSDQQKEAQFVSEVLENIAELSSSPHTILVPNGNDREKPCLTLQGAAIPQDRLTYFALRCVNSDGGIQYDVSRKMNEKVSLLYKQQH